jgi:Flp pilus assembly protein TadD
LERAVQRSAGQDTPEVIAVLHGLGVLLLQQGDDEQAKIVLSRCLAFWRERGDASGMALELNSLSVAHRNLGDIDTARDLLTEGVELARKSGDCRKLASLLSTSSVLEIDNRRAAARNRAALRGAGSRQRTRGRVGRGSRPRELVGSTPGGGTAR